MANIKVKNKANVEVIYNNIDTVVLPTTDGEPAVFRQWTGAGNGSYKPDMSVTSKNFNITTGAPLCQIPEVTIELV